MNAKIELLISCRQQNNTVSFDPLGYAEACTAIEGDDGHGRLSKKKRSTRSLAVSPKAVEAWRTVAICSVRLRVR